MLNPKDSPGGTLAGRGLELLIRKPVPATDSPLTVPALDPVLLTNTVAPVVALTSTEGNVMVVPEVRAWRLPSANV